MITNQEYLETVKSMRNRTTRLDHEGDYWTQEEREKLVVLFDSGEGITDIAVQLQRTEPAVFQQIEKLDLYKRKENPVRHRDQFKPRGCLCDRCRLDVASCPRSAACVEEQEGMGVMHDDFSGGKPEDNVQTDIESEDTPTAPVTVPVTVPTPQEGNTQIKQNHCEI